MENRLNKMILDILPYFEKDRDLNVLDLNDEVVQPVENYAIKENSYDLIIAISVLEQINTKDSFIEKLCEIKRGLRERGVVYLVINSNVEEHDKLTGEEVPVQIGINLDTKELKKILLHFFGYWKILKFTIQHQQYDVPREHAMREWKTKVVTLVARK